MQKIKAGFIMASLLAGCVLLFAACKTEPKKLTLGFLVPQAEELWFQEEWKFAQQFADANNINLVKIGIPDGDKTLAAIDSLAAQGAKGFIICAPDVRLGPAIIARANAHQLKVFTVDDQLVGADGQPMIDVPYMGLSAKNIGLTVGDTLAEEMQRRAWDMSTTAAMAMTFNTLSTMRERTDGVRESLIKAGFPESQIFEGPLKITDVPSSLDAGTILITQHPEVKNWLIYGGNDESVLGAVRALENQKFKAENILAVGIGASSGVVEFKKSEVTGFYAFALISPYRHGYETMELLFKWVSKNEVPPMDTRTAATIVTRDNYMEQFNQLGLDLPQ